MASRVPRGGGDAGLLPASEVGPRVCRVKFPGSIDEMTATSLWWNKSSRTLPTLHFSDDDKPVEVVLLMWSCYTGVHVDCWFVVCRG